MDDRVGAGFMGDTEAGRALRRAAVRNTGVSSERGRWSGWVGATTATYEGTDAYGPPRVEPHGSGGLMPLKRVMELGSGWRMTRERRYEAGPWLANAAWAGFGSEARVIELLDGGATRDGRRAAKPQPGEGTRGARRDRKESGDDLVGLPAAAPSSTTTVFARAHRPLSRSSPSQESRLVAPPR